MAWTGFTDEQLNSLKRQTSDEEERPRSGRPQGQHPQRGRGRGGASRGRGRTNAAQSVRQEPVSQDQMLSKPRQQGLKGKPVSKAERSVWNELNDPSPQRPPPARRKAAPPRSDGEEKKEEGAKHQVKEEVEKTEEKEEKKEEEKVKILDENEGQERDLSKLEEFQKMQKQMEEENAKKTCLLSRAIADRKKKTQAEAKRLLYIQKELAKIETLLTNDVSIIRDRIETASRDFNEAQRRYQKAEAEFVLAKIHLHKTTDMKEALTEHLCTIIHENELRKAKKLEELVGKLDVDNLDEFEIPEETPPTSPVQSVPQKASHADITPTNNGPVPESDNASEEVASKKEHSTVTSGVDSQQKRESTAATGVRALANHEGQPGDVSANTLQGSDGKEETDIADPPKISAGDDQKGFEAKSSIEAECAVSNDQPEAEQHVKLSEDQT